MSMWKPTPAFRAEQGKYAVVDAAHVKEHLKRLKAVLAECENGCFVRNFWFAGQKCTVKMHRVCGNGYVDPPNKSTMDLDVKKIEVHGGFTGGPFGFDTAHSGDITHFTYSDIVPELGSIPVPADYSLKTLPWIIMETQSVATQIASVDRVYLSQLKRCQRYIRAWQDRRYSRARNSLRRHLTYPLCRLVVDEYLRQPEPKIQDEETIDLGISLLFAEA